jgi:hypothetical protein
MFRRLSIALLVTTASMPLSSAQMRGAMGRPVPMAHAGFARGVGSGIGPHHKTRPFTRGIPLSSFLLDSGYDDSDYDANEPYMFPGNVQGVPPQIVVVQAASVDDSPRRAKPGPSLIEWRGDRYVRFGGADASEQSGTSAHPDYAEPTITKTPTKPGTKQLMSATQKEPAEPAEPQAGEFPPAMLVYRDGGREEIADYAIADGVIYVQGDYWQNGSWTKRIPLSAIDPAATMRANQQRGVKFMLPSASNVVIASF